MTTLRRWLSYRIKRLGGIVFGLQPHKAPNSLRVRLGFLIYDTGMRLYWGWDCWPRREKP